MGITNVAQRHTQNADSNYWALMIHDFKAMVQAN